MHHLFTAESLEALVIVALWVGAGFSNLLSDSTLNIGMDSRASRLVTEFIGDVVDLDRSA